LPGYIFILVLLLLMWFLLIRPQRKRQLEQQRMIDALRVGQEVVTAGGLYGTVTAVEEDEVRLEIADGLEVRIAKRAVAGIVGGDEEEPAELEEGGGTEPADEENPATLSR
jgi:preprotein translocase subunit YajC